MITKQVNPMSEKDQHEMELNSILKRIETLKEKKIGAERELQLLRKRYDELLLSLKERGIENVKDAPEVIKQRKKKIEDSLNLLGQQVLELEEKVV